jgi:Resolvase, N terminal domain.
MVAFTKGSRTQTMDHSVRNLVVAILSWVAEGERQNLSERTKAEVARARQCVSTSEGLFGRATGTVLGRVLVKRDCRGRQSHVL